VGYWEKEREREREREREKQDWKTMTLRSESDLRGVWGKSRGDYYQICLCMKFSNIKTVIL
jgi:hypothetical protein